MSVVMQRFCITTDKTVTRTSKKVVQTYVCIRRESNPELGHGKTQCYRYTTNAHEK